MPMCSDTLLCDTSTGTPRPFVPENFRRTVFDSLHCLSHPGIRATQRLVTTRFVWPGINSDVRKWARSCVQCQRAKVHRHTTTPLATFATPDARFDQIHLDLVGPLPPSQGYNNCSHVSIDSLAGQKQYQSLTALQTLWLKLLLLGGYHDMESPLPSPQTEVNNLSQPSGHS